MKLLQKASDLLIKLRTTLLTMIVPIVFDLALSTSLNLTVSDVLLEVGDEGWVRNIMCE